MEYTTQMDAARKGIVAHIFSDHPCIGKVVKLLKHIVEHKRYCKRPQAACYTACGQISVFI